MRKFHKHDENEMTNFYWEGKSFQKDDPTAKPQRQNISYKCKNRKNPGSEWISNLN